jgi:hypothetical protein
VDKYGTARQATEENIIWRMRFACWITKACSSHSQYVIITTFPRQHWLPERASMLRYTHTACLVLIFQLFHISNNAPLCLSTNNIIIIPNLGSICLRIFLYYLYEIRHLTSNLKSPISKPEEFHRDFSVNNDI